MVLIDSIIRLIPNVLGHKDSVRFESFQDNMLEYPQYTRPAVYKGMKVPDTLLSGNHKDIEEWRMTDELAVSAYRVGKYKESERLCDEILSSGKLPEREVARVKQNREYARRELAKQ